MSSPLATQMRQKAEELAISWALSYALPKVVTWLRAGDHINAAEALAAKGAIGIAKDLKDIKTEETFPNQNVKGQATFLPDNPPPS